MQCIQCKHSFEGAYRRHKKEQMLGAYFFAPLLSMLMLVVAYFKFENKFAFYVPVLFFVGCLVYSTYHVGFKGLGNILTRTARSLELTDENVIVVNTWPWFKQPARSIPLTAASLRVRKRATLDFLILKQQPVFLVQVNCLEVIIFEQSFNDQINLDELFQKASSEV